MSQPVPSTGLPAPEPVEPTPSGVVGGGAPRAGWRAILAGFLRHRAAVFGLVVVVLVVLFSFVGPLIYQTDQVHTDLTKANLPPSSQHPLGTDDVGYDQLGRLMLGGQTSLEVGLFAALIATVIGALWGAISGFLGGVVDGLMMRIVDALISIPTLFLLLYLSAVLQPTRWTLILVIGFVAWLGPARLIRGEALKLRTQPYVDAVRMMGGGRTRIIRRHILPNTIGTMVVNTTFQIADGVLALAGLSFLGLGIPPPSANWGSMLSNGVNYTWAGAWWLIYPPGLAIVLTIIAFNFIGDGLRDAFEHRLARR